MVTKLSLAVILALILNSMAAVSTHDPRLWYKKCKTVTIKLPPPTCLGNAMTKMGCYRIT